MKSEHLYIIKYKIVEGGLNMQHIDYDVQDKKNNLRSIFGKSEEKDCSLLCKDLLEKKEEDYPDNMLPNNGNRSLKRSKNPRPIDDNELKSMFDYRSRKMS